MEIIRLENVTKSFKGQTILKNINLSIASGETVGLIGGNGSGKSVLFKLIAGLYKPDSGSVYVGGKKLGEDFDFPPDMGILIDEPGYVDYLTGFQNLRNLADILGKIDDQKIKDTMRLLRLDPDNRNIAKNYSLGMKQKLGICQAIMEDQSIIILDEPFNALDYQSYEDIKEVLVQMKSQGRTLLLTSHNNRDINDLCDRIFFVANQQIVPFTEEISQKYFSRS